MKKLAFSIIFILIGSASIAQQHTLSLEQSKQAALAYSNAIKNGQLRINSAESGVAAAKADYLPSVSGMGVGLYGFKDFVPAIPDVLNKGINNIYLLGATATEALYAGGKIRTGNQLASLQLEVSKILARQSADSVLLLTEQKYWNIVNLQEQGKTLQANEKLLNSMLKMQKDMLASGLIARNDLLKVKVQLSQLQVNKSKVQNGRRLALFDFALYTGIPYDSLMVMQDNWNNSQALALPVLQPDTNLSKVTSYQLLNKRLESESLQTRLTRGDNLPSVAVGLSATQFGSIRSGLGSTTSSVALATVSIPISEGLWGRGKQKVKQRKIAEQMAQNDFRDGRNQLKVGIMQRWYDWKDGLTQVSYAQESLVQATENLKVNQDNYKAGLAAVSDVLDAQAAYQQAASTLNTAYADLQVKKAAYDFATGNISNNRQ